MVLVEMSAKKRQIWLSEPHFGEFRGDARWLVGKPMVDFFRYLLRFRSYETKCVQLGCFCRAVDLFALKFYRDRAPSTVFGVRKLETVGYPMVKTPSLCVPSFWHSTREWRTDSRICRPQRLQRCAVKMFTH